MVTASKVILVTETKIQGRMSKNIRLLQTSGNCAQIYVQNEGQNQMFLFETKIQIRGLDCTD